MTHRTRVFVAGILFVAAALTPVAVVAGLFEDGKAAYDNGDYATALQLWRPLADQGDAAAQFSIGITYLTKKDGPGGTEQ